MRKLFSLLLVAAMVLGLVGTAFAATDVTGTKYESAVARLNALSILRGYEDGSFRPNNNITRAEFAAVAVRALGLEDAAKNTFGATKFADVPASHWAAGYINVAVGRGIIKGYPDGSFKPEANVTNAEAMAMLIRVLGYEPAVTGEWPMNYVSKAAEIGLTSGLSLGTDQPALRGDVALMTNNALTIKLMVQSTYGTLTGYTVSNETLLANKLAITELKDKVVTATPLYDRVGLKANEIKLDGVTYTFDSTLNVEGLIGHKVDAWAKDGNIFYIVDKTPASEIVSFTVKAADSVLRTITYEGPTTGSGDDVVYTVDAAATIYYNHVTNAFNAALATNLVGSSVTLVIDPSDNEARFVTALKYDPSYVVTKVDTTAKTIKAVDQTGTESTFDLSTAKYTIVDATGAVKTLADVAKNDILSVATNGAPAQYWFRIVRNSVTGEVTKTTTTDDSSLSAYKVYVGATAYSVASNAAIRSGSTYTPITTANVDSLVGTKGTFYLDAAGKIRLADTTAAPVTVNLAFVDTIPWKVATVDGDTWYVKILKLDGTKVTMPVDSALSADAALTTVGNLIEYSTTDGIIDSVTVATPSAQGNVTVNATYDRLTIGTSTYVVTADTKIYSQIGGAGTKPTSINWAVVEGAQGTVTATVVANPDFPARADLIIITGGTLQSAQTTAVMMKYSYTVSSSGSLVKHMVVDEKGTEKDYAVASSAEAALAAFKPGELATLTFDSNNKVSVINELTPTAIDHQIVSGELDSAAGILSVGGANYFSTSNTVVYDYSGSSPVKVDWSAVQIGTTITFYNDASNNLTYVVITAK